MSRTSPTLIAMTALALSTFGCAGASSGGVCQPGAAPVTSSIEPNLKTSFSLEVHEPSLQQHDFVHPHATVIGAVEMGDGVFVAPSASVRGDEGQPIHIGAGSNVQDGAVLHALETFDEGHAIEGNIVHVGGQAYALYVGDNVSIAHQAQIHGPAVVGENTFVGMQSLVFRAEVGANCVLEPRALVMGVKVAPGRYVPAGSIITTQAQADALPMIDEHYPLAKMNAGVLRVNHQLADGYAERTPRTAR